MWGRRAGVRIGLALLGQDPADALQFFRAANQDFPLLKDYIRLWMGEALVGSGAVRRAAKEFQSILELDSPSILKQEALLRAGLAWYEAGVCAEAISFLRQAVSLDMDSTRAARAWSGVADCADRLGQPDQAREALREIWRRYPETSEAETVNELVKNGRTNGLQWNVLIFRAANQDFPLLKDYIRLWMGEALVGSGAVRRAAKEFQSILELDSPSILKQEALLRAGLAWYEAGVCAEAISFRTPFVSRNKILISFRSNTNASTRYKRLTLGLCGEGGLVSE